MVVGGIPAGPGPGPAAANAGGTWVYVDDGTTLAMVRGGDRPRPGQEPALRALLAEPACDDDRFVAAIWRAAALPGRALDAGAAARGPLQDVGWGAVIVTAGAGSSPYEALREVTAAGQPLRTPVACLTLGGDALRGQNGRRWQAVRGNLHLSVAMPCDLDAAACAPSLPMLAAVALCEAVEDLLGGTSARAAGLGIKWVNDVVLAGGKAGGVLTALRTRGPRVEAYFAGLALNLAKAPVLAPDPFTQPATSLAGPGGTVPLAPAAAAVLARLRSRLEQVADAGCDGLVDAYRARSVVLGREVAIWPDGTRERLAAAPGQPVPPPERYGRVEAIGPDLALHLAGQALPVTGGCLRLVDGPNAGRPRG